MPARPYHEFDTSGDDSLDPLTMGLDDERLQQFPAGYVRDRAELRGGRLGVPTEVSDVDFDGYATTRLPDWLVGSCKVLLSVTVIGGVAWGLVAAEEASKKPNNYELLSNEPGVDADITATGIVRSTLGLPLYSSLDTVAIRDAREAVSGITSITLPTKDSLMLVIAKAQEKVATNMVIGDRWATSLDEITAKVAKDSKAAGKSDPSLLAAAQQDYIISTISGATPSDTLSTDTQALLAKSVIPEATKQAISAAVAVKIEGATITTTIGYVNDRSVDDITKKISAVQLLPETPLRAKALANLELTKAYAISTGLSAGPNGYMGLTKQQAQALIPTITDPELLTDLEGLLGAYNTNLRYQGWNFNDAARTISSKYFAKQTMDAIIRDATVVLSPPQTALSTLADQEEDAYEEAMVQISNQVITNLQNANQLTSVEIPALLSTIPADPGATVDLRGVKGKTTIPDISRYKGDLETDFKTRQTLSQFAEVTVRNGVLTTSYDANDKLTQQSKDYIQMAIDHSMPLLQAAFADGTLQSLSFTIGDEFNPFFNPLNRQIVMALSADNTMSVNQLAATLTHETIHSLMVNVFNGVNANQMANTLISTACNSLKVSLYNQLQTKISVSDEVFTRLQAELKPEDVVIFADMLAAAKTNQLTPALSKSLGTGSAYLNSCYQADGAFGESIIYYANKNKITTSLSYIWDLPAMEEFEKSWADLIRYAAVYEKINESNYVMTASPDKAYLGHSEDNATETGASLMDAMLNFAPQLATAIKNMPEDQKNATMVSLESFVQIIIGEHPQLGILMTSSLETVKTLLSK